VTIVHLGDGHIAADRFTSTLRSALQARFGDAGRGLMAPGMFRIAEADIERKGNWTTASSAAGDPGPFGLAGVRLTGHEGATLELALPRAPFDWAEITFATNRDTGKVHVEVDGKGDTVGTSTMEPTWQRIRVKAGGTALKLRVEGGGPVHILSLAVGRDAPGVRYINLGVPQATALTAKRWDQDIVAAELKHLAPDLILVGYGTNEAFDDQLDPREYTKYFNDFLKRLRADAPEASLLVIGAPDVAYIPRFAAGTANDACRPLSETERAEYGRLIRERSPRLGRWHPPLGLQGVRRAARRAASAAGAYFWDWSAMMGGPCSIHAWVHTQPPLALASHRHFTPEGARHSAEALFRDLLNGYERHRVAATARAEK
jgi:lysophospholipase L1-like esterase